MLRMNSGRIPGDRLGRMALSCVSIVKVAEVVARDPGARVPRSQRGTRDIPVRAVEMLEVLRSRKSAPRIKCDRDTNRRPVCSVSFRRRERGVGLVEIRSRSRCRGSPRRVSFGNLMIARCGKNNVADVLVKSRFY